MDPLEEFLLSFLEIKQKAKTITDDVEFQTLKNEFWDDCIDLWNEGVSGSQLDPKTRKFHNVPRI